jgi:transcriptional regulator with PAS, ATPase and Fis domain
MLVGPVLAPVLELARRAVRAGLSTVLEGETGTGKELLARAMHAWSQRLGPFVAVNCAALPETLAEAELFGYRKGAFTGASRASAGQLRGAHRGTLLLDEIQRLAPALQAKLLRVLDQREVVPLGEAVPVPIDVFVLAATQRPLGELVEKAQFARDLQMRLEGATLKLPTLRARRQELGFLLAELLAKYGGERVPAVDARLVEALCLYDWPGNLRELDQLVHRLLSLRGHEPRLRVSHLPAHVRQRAAGEQTEPEPIGAGSGLAPREAPVAAPERLRVRPLTREVLAQALRARGGNVQRAAEDVGVRRQDFYRFFSKRELAAFRRARRSDPGGEPE